MLHTEYPTWKKIWTKSKIINLLVAKICIYEQILVRSMADRGLEVWRQFQFRSVQVRWLELGFLSCSCTFLYECLHALACDTVVINNYDYYLLMLHHSIFACNIIICICDSVAKLYFCFLVGVDNHLIVIMLANIYLIFLSGFNRPCFTYDSKNTGGCDHYH